MWFVDICQRWVIINIRLFWPIRWSNYINSYFWFCTFFTILSYRCWMWVDNAFVMIDDFCLIGEWVIIGWLKSEVDDGCCCGDSEGFKGVGGSIEDWGGSIGFVLWLVVWANSEVNDTCHTWVT